MKLRAKIRFERPLIFVIRPRRNVSARHREKRHSRFSVNYWWVSQSNRYSLLCIANICGFFDESKFLLVFFLKIYPQGSRKGEIAWMICESVGSVFWAFRRKTSKRRGYTNFGQSSVTKTLPPPLQVRIGKSGGKATLIWPTLASILDPVRLK